MRFSIQATKNIGFIKNYYVEQPFGWSSYFFTQFRVVSKV